MPTSNAVWVARRGVVVLSFVLAASSVACTSNDSNRAAEGRLGGLSESLAPTPVVGPEFDMDQPAFPGSGVPEVDQAAASNAAGTTLVVWSVNSGVVADIYGTRVDALGNVLDPNGIPICTAPFGQQTPEVASDGSGWFVVWDDQHDGGSHDIRGTRVTAAGAVLDPVGIAIATSNMDEGFPAVASDGTNFLVAWSIGNATLDPMSGAPANLITAARVDASGSVLDPLGFTLAITLPASIQVPPRASLAFDGTHWVAVWNTGRTGTNSQDIVGSRLTSTGGFAGSFVVSAATGDQTSPSIECQGAACFVAWEGAGIQGSRWSAGAALDPAGITVASDPRGLPDVAWDGTNWVVAWNVSPNPFTSGPVRAARVSAVGSVLDANSFSLFSGARNVALARSGNRAFAAAGTSIDGATRGTFVTSAGSAVEPLLVSIAPASSALLPGALPAAAASQSNFLVVWVDDRHGSPTIYGTRVTPSGAILDPNGIQISLPHASQSAPKVASDGVNWLVVWSDNRNGTDNDVYGTRVTAGGLRQDSEATLILGGSENQNSPLVAFNGVDWLVAAGRDSPPFSPRAVRLDSNGAVVDPSPIELDLLGAVSGGGGQWLVVGSVFDTVDGNSDVYGQRIAGDGSVLDPTPFPVSLSSTAFQTRLAAAYGLGEWLVVWENNGTGTVSATRVDTSATVLDPGSIAIATRGTSFLPAVSYDGTNFLVAWWDLRAWEPTASRNITPPYDVFGARVSASGALLDAAGIGIATGGGSETDVAVASNAGRSLVVYQQSSGPDAGVRARIVDESGGLGGAGAGCAGMGGSPGGGGGMGGAGAGCAGMGGAGGAAAGVGGAGAGQGGHSGASGEDGAGFAGEGGADDGGEGGDASSGAGVGGEGSPGGGASGSSGGGVAGDSSSGGSAGGGDTPDPGCGCSVPARPSNGGAAILLAALLFAGRVRRRVPARRGR